MVWLAIVFIALLVYTTRIFGVVVMARMLDSLRLKRFLDTMAICVVAGLVASLLPQAGGREFAAAAAAVLTMALMRNALLAMTVGVAVAAIWSQIS